MHILTAHILRRFRISLSDFPLGEAVTQLSRLVATVTKSRLGTPLSTIIRELSDVGPDCAVVQQEILSILADFTSAARPPARPAPALKPLQLAICALLNLSIPLTFLLSTSSPP